MLQTLARLNWAQLSMLSIPALAAAVASVMCRLTNLLKSPQLGIFDPYEYSLVMEGLKAEEVARQYDELTCQPIEGWTPPPHQCVVDYERSQVTVNEDDTVTVGCAVSGCNRTMVLGHNIATKYVVARD